METIKTLKNYSNLRIRQGVGLVLEKQYNLKIKFKFKSALWGIQSIRFTLPEYNQIEVGDKITVWKRGKQTRVGFLSQYALIYYNVMIAQKGVAHPLVIRIMDRFSIDDLLSIEVVEINGYFKTVHKVGDLAVVGIKGGYGILRAVGLVG